MSKQVIYGYILYDVLLLINNIFCSHYEAFSPPSQERGVLYHAIHLYTRHNGCLDIWSYEYPPLLDMHLDRAKVPVAKAAAPKVG